MPELQPYFEQFNNEIRLGRFTENATLREKRDVVLSKLKDRLKKVFEDKGEEPPTYKAFGQGSYAMNTGVKPLGADYDIDVAIELAISINDYEDPVEAKSWLYDALNVPPHEVEMRRPCVTVIYSSEGEPVYHVDLAIYSSGDSNTDDRIYLAKGKLNSAEENRQWEEADPKGLISLVDGRFSGDDAKQFRRVIRYLKRWKDIKFPADGNAAPIGIGITIAAYHWFRTVKTLTDVATGTYKYQDDQALKQFLMAVIDQFKTVYNDGEWAERLKVDLPVAPYNDLFKKMSNNQMSQFKEKLEAILVNVDEAMYETDPHEACKKLRRVFGDDFPVPEKKNTAQALAPAFISGGSSA